MTRRVHSMTSMLLAVTAVLTIVDRVWANGTVSPGEADRFAAVELRCPTFSWESVPGAEAFELAVFALPAGLEPAQIVDSDLGPEAEVLYALVGGGATAWTPAAERCLDAGGDYAWFVRPVVDEQPGAWSDARFFAVPAAPSETELRQALDVLQRWSATEGTSLAIAVAEPATATRPGETVAGPAGTAGATAKSIPTAVAAIRGDNADTSGEAYGLIGTSASTHGAGLGAANSAGGADLVLDGSADGSADTLLRESGIDRPSPSAQRYEVRNSGGGGMTLDVAGAVEADVLRCPSCVSSTTIADGSIATADLAVNAVDSTRIANGTIQTVDLADDIINTNKLVDGSVRTADIFTGAVTSAKIADGTITAADLAPGAVDPGWKPARVIMVSESGGDFTDIQDAIDSVSGASSTEQYLIRVGPGVYDHGGPIVMTPYVHLQGAGQDITVLAADVGTSAPPTQGSLMLASHSRVSDLTIHNSSSSDYNSIAILAGAGTSDARVSDVTTIIDGGTSLQTGIYATGAGTSVTLERIMAHIAGAATSDRAIYASDSAVIDVIHSNLAATTAVAYASGGAIVTLLFSRFEGGTAGAVECVGIIRNGVFHGDSCG